MTDDGKELVGRVFHVRNFAYDVRIYSRCTRNAAAALVVEWDDKPPEMVLVVNARRWIKEGEWYD